MNDEKERTPGLEKTRGAANPSPIEALGLPKQVEQLLKQNGIQWVEQLDESALFTLRGADVATLRLIRRKWDTFTLDPSPQTPAAAEQQTPSDAQAGTPIDQLQLSVRAYNALWRNHIGYVEELQQLSDDELLALRGMGIISFQNIREQMAKWSSCEWSKPVFLPTETAETEEGLIPLEQMGLSVRAYNILMRNHIRWAEELFQMSDEELLALPGMGKTTYQNIQERLAEQEPYLQEKMQRAIADKCQSDGPRETLLVFPRMERKWKALIKNKLLLSGFDGITEEALSAELTSHMLPAIYQTLMEQLAEEGLCCLEGERWNLRFLSVYDDAEKLLPNERLCTVWQKRLLGHTLQQLGEEVGLTRERVRQMVQKALKHLIQHAELPFREDLYQRFYENYQLTPVVFCSITEEPRRTWEYLKLRYQKKDQQSVYDAAEDETLPVILRDKIALHMDALDELHGVLRLEGQQIELSKSAIEDHLLRTRCHDTVSIDAFYQMYNDFLREHQLEQPFLQMNQMIRRTRENRLSRLPTVLWTQNRRLRYYNMPDMDFTELLEELDLKQYHSVEISSRKLLLEHPRLMRHYDIRDEYELHNLLKKIHAENENPSLVFGRMPGLQFGVSSREAVTFSAMQRLAPVSREALCAELSAETGYLPETISGTWLDCIEVYYHDQVYSMDFPCMPEADFQRLRDALSEDFYTFDEAWDIYSRLSDQPDRQYFTPFNLKRMGFQVYRTFILKNWRSAEQYFTDVLTREDVYNYELLNKRLSATRDFNWQNIAHNSIVVCALNDLKGDYDVVEFAPHQILSIRRLKQFGVDKAQLCQFCDLVYDCTCEGDLFTLYQLRDAGLKSDLDQLGFEDCFFQSILKEDPRFAHQNMGGNVLFFRGPGPITRQTLLRYLVCKEGKMDTDELLDMIQQEYGIKMDKEDISSVCQNCELYFDRIMDAVYANYDIYYNEV